MRSGMLVLALLCVAAPGCKKKPVASLDGADSAPIVQTAPPASSTAAAIQELADGFRRVNFAYDSSTLDDVALAALESNAKILGEHAEIVVQVQGHADERGTTDYNLALGQRRADAVKRALVSAGVATSRVQTITYGEERPLATGHETSAWAENRRAEFVIVAH